MKKLKSNIAIKLGKIRRKSEQSLGNYDHIMAFTRTVTGIIVLVVQFFILSRILG